MNTFNKFAVALILTLTAFAASATDYSSSGYEGNQSRRMEDVTTGQVISMRTVTIQGQPSTSVQVLTSSIGGLVGGLVGSKIGNGNATYAITAVTTVLGGAAGAYGAEVLNKQEAVEFIVRLDSGRTVAISQSIDTESSTIQKGDLVRVIQGQTTRVIRM